ncbi:MAG: hypothetical protein ACOYMZ_00230 [Minisyncoccia bacterium]
MKIKLIVCALLAIVVMQSATAQSLKKKKNQGEQVDPDKIEVYMFYIPQTDSLQYKNVLPETIVILGADDGKTKGKAKLVMMSPAGFSELKENMESSRDYYKEAQLPPNTYLGFALSVISIGQLSLLTSEQIKTLPTDQQKVAAMALNGYTKYTLNGQLPIPVLGIRDGQGDIIPDFNFTFSRNQSMEENRSNQKEQGVIPQGQGAKKDAWEELMQKARPRN